MKILVICGPTATGKTELAVKIAKKFNGELISSDSRQIYKGMDIGTGKDIPKYSKLKTRFLTKLSDRLILLSSKYYRVGYYQIENIPLWLLDIVDPDQSFSAGEYQKLAWKVIEDIWKRGKIPILVGGTGLYIKTVVNGIETVGIPQDWNLRKKLKKLSLENLQKKLQEMDTKKWNSMNNSDKNNSRRLIRAIEIANFKSKSSQFDRPIYQTEKKDILMIGLTAPNKILYQRIDKRVEKRIEQGIIKEIKSLLDKGHSWDLPSMSSLGYRVWKDFFNKKATKEEVTQRWKYDEHAYARRQLTWFKKDKRIIWFDITSFTFAQQVMQKIKTWLSK